MIMMWLIDWRLAPKEAVTLTIPVAETVQVPLPVQAPLHPWNVKPLAGVAVKATWVPSLKFARQVGPQSIPPGALATMPVPPPVMVTAIWNSPAGGPGTGTKPTQLDIHRAMVTTSTARQALDAICMNKDTPLKRTLDEKSAELVGCSGSLKTGALGPSRSKLMPLQANCRFLACSLAASNAVADGSERQVFK